MKKVIFALAAIVLLISCSGDDAAASNPFNTNGVRLKRSTLVFNNGATTATGEYFYSGNHLSRISSSDGYSTFAYSGDLIIRSDGYSNANVLQGTALYQYNSNNQITLSTSLNYPINRGYKIVYYYNDDNSVTINTFTGDLNSQTTQEPETTRIYFENDEIVKKEISGLINGVTVTDTYTYTYDGKNNPNKNMMGFQKIMFYQKYFGPAIYDNLQNMLKITSATTTTSETDFYTYHYTYNSFNYPIKSQRFDSDGSPMDGIKFYYYE